MITQTIDLNLIPGGILPRINVSQYDKGARTLTFNLYNGVSAFTVPTGASVYIVGTKKDNTGFEYSCIFSGNTVSVDITDQMTVFAGEVQCELRVIKDSKQIGTGNFVLNVENTALADDVTISETDIPIIQNIPQYVTQAANSANLAHQWATYGADSETPSATNNAKYWAEQAAQTDIGQFEERYEEEIYGVETPNPQSIQHQLNSVTELGVRNFANCTATTNTTNGVTFTVNSDKKISATWSATPTATAMLTYSSGMSLISGKEYTVKGCPTGGAWASGNFKYRLYVRNITDNATVANDVGDGATFTPVSGKTYGLYIDVGINAGSSGSLTFEPLVKLSSDPDDTYVPYAMTNRELTEVVSSARLATNLHGIRTGNVKQLKCVNTTVANFKNWSVSNEYKPHVPTGQGDNYYQFPVYVRDPSNNSVYYNGYVQYSGASGKFDDVRYFASYGSVATVAPDTFYIVGTITYI